MIEFRKDRETREALSEIFGLTPISFEIEWKQWVKDTYPLR